MELEVAADDPDHVEDVAIRLKPHGKWTGPRLGDWIANRQARRERLQENPITTAEARERRRQRRAGHSK